MRKNPKEVAEVKQTQQYRSDGAKWMQSELCWTCRSGQWRLRNLAGFFEISGVSHAKSVRPDAANWETLAERRA
jgi:hypothetical protein